MISNPIVVSDHKFDASDFLLANELSGKSGSVQLAELRYYLHNEGWLWVEQLAVPTFPLRNVQGSSVKSRLLSIRALTYDCHNVRISLMRSAEWNPRILRRRLQSQNKVEKRSERKDSRRYHRLEVTAVALCTNPKQKVKMNRLSVHCVLLKSSVGTANH